MGRMKTLMLGFAFCLAVVNGDVDYQVVRYAYLEGASVAKYPQLQAGAPADTLKDAIINATTDYIDRLTKIYYFQVNSAAFFFGRSAEKMINNLERSISMLNDRSPDNALDHSLGLVSDSFETCIDIIPQEFGGDAVTGSADFSGLDDLMLDKPVNVTSMQSIGRLLNDLPAVADNDFSILQKFITSVFAHGWEKARPAFIKLRDEFREALLFQSIFMSYKSCMRYVREHQDIIQAYTSDAAWNRAVALLDRLSEIMSIQVRSIEEPKITNSDY